MEFNSYEYRNTCRKADDPRVADVTDDELARRLCEMVRLLSTRPEAKIETFHASAIVTGDRRRQHMDIDFDAATGALTYRGYNSRVVTPPWIGEWIEQPLEGTERRHALVHLYFEYLPAAQRRIREEAIRRLSSVLSGEILGFDAGAPEDKG